MVHSKYYRSPLVYASKKVIVVGNSASGHDVTAELVSTARLPVYQSRRSPSRWDGDAPPPGIEWKPVIKEYVASTGRIVFEDDTHLDPGADFDAVVYATGYKPSFPFWRHAAERPLWDYAAGRLVDVYWHTFPADLPSLAVVGIPRTLTFRSFEYQGIALARLWSGRNAVPLPPVEEQRRWERERAELTRREGRKFHDIPWEGGEAKEWLRGLFEIAGLGTLTGEGRIPPVLTREMVWALENIRKYPEPGRDGDGDGDGKDKGKGKGEDGTTDNGGDEFREARSTCTSCQSKEEEEGAGEWVVVNRPHKMDLIGFI